jgi:site-specific DNA-methyltransferase (adenine-specific)
MHPIYAVVCARAEEALPLVGKYDTCFADPPDNLNWGYDEFQDKWASVDDYIDWLYGITKAMLGVASTVWVSYNAKYDILYKAKLRELVGEIEIKPFVQVFEFGWYRSDDCSNNHRPLVRLRSRHARLYPSQIKVPSWRLLHGDKRAKKGGRVPGDVWSFPRVTGNSRQRRRWHPTQLHEGLVERALKLTTPPGGRVLDPFGGTGTTLRVAKALGLSCTLIELSENYCKRICAENDVPMYKIVAGRLRPC